MSVATDLRRIWCVFPHGFSYGDLGETEAVRAVDAYLRARSSSTGCAGE